MANTLTDHERALVEFVKTNEYTITNALRVYAERMREGAVAARQQFEAGHADPVVKAAQNASLIANQGYRMAAEMAEESASSAVRVADELSGLVDDVAEEG